MAAPFSYPFMYWVGMDVSTDDPEALETVNRDYQGHVSAILAAHPGFRLGRRYELISRDYESATYPRYLTVYEMTDEEVAGNYIVTGVPASRPESVSWNTATTMWQMIFRRLSERGLAVVPMDSITLVGIEPPADAGQQVSQSISSPTIARLANVVASCRYSRGVTYGLYHEILHPAPGCPRIIAVLEGSADESDANKPTTTLPLQHDIDEDETASDTDPWSEFDLRWRARYRRIDTA